MRNIEIPTEIQDQVANNISIILNILKKNMEFWIYLFTLCTPNFQPYLAFDRHISSNLWIMDEGLALTTARGNFSSCDILE